MLQCTQRDRYFYEFLFLFPLDICPEAGLLGLHEFTAPPTMHKGSLFSTSFQHLFFLDFMKTVILTSVSWHLNVVLVCFSLISIDVKHLFMCLLAMCTSSWKKCVLRLLAYFLTDIFGYWIVCVFYILDSNPLSYIWFANIFSHSIDCLLILLTDYFVVQETFNVI